MTAPTPSARLTAPLDPLLTQLAGRIALGAASRIGVGCLTVELPDGSRRVFGDRDSDLRGEMIIHDTDALKRILLGGEVGGGEAFMEGLWSSPDLVSLISLAVANRHSLALSKGWWRIPARAARTVGHRRNRNTKAGSRRNITAHYDLGNDFYKLWLDETMTYSSALFESPDQPLADAQRNKYRAIAADAGLQAGDHVLEIGTGWGGFALFAAGELGCRVTTVTVSQAQHDLARERIADAGLSDQVSVELSDYRDIDGSYDAVVSIEMLEAVGAEYYRDYFEACARALKPGGRLSIQVITFPHDAYEAQLRGANWIQRYIFPGGVLPSLAAIESSLEGTGLLVTGVRDIRDSYALTLKTWRESFFEHLHEVRAMGFDDRFVRMWDYYLSISEAGFRTGMTQDLQIAFEKIARQGLGGRRHEDPRRWRQWLRRWAPRFDSLLDRGHDVRLASRNPRGLRPRFPEAEVVEVDLLRPETLPGALEGVELVYYLAHSMAAGESGFVERDRAAARAFGEAAQSADVKHIVYLGGLGDPSSELSEHLASRQQVGAELAAHGVPVTEFRAAIIIGSGSASFELLRSLVERLPVMVTPRWVRTLGQPIAIRDVLDYLVEAADHPERSGVVEIGGPDVLSYAEMMQTFARLRGMRRWMIPVPVLTPRLSSYWCGLVTPVPSAIARPLIEGLRNEVVVRDPEPARAFGVRPMSYEAAVRLAIKRIDGHEVETTWFDSTGVPGRGDLEDGGSREGMIVDSQRRRVRAPAEVTFAEIERLGGTAGWPFANLLWSVRGLMDRMVGGPGMRLGRRNPARVRVGDAVDFWRVEAVERPRVLRLRAEMRVPGRAWLQYEVSEDGQASQVTQTAFFEPKGISGLVYWYLLLPVHLFIFRGSIRELTRRAEQAAGQPVRS